VLAKARQMVDRQRQSFVQALEIGVPIALGTDAGGLGHGNNARELGYMVDAGMSPLQAIAAATADAAQCIGLGEETGLIAQGRLADLLLVQGDPLSDVRLLEDRTNIRLIMKGGDLVKADLP